MSAALDTRSQDDLVPLGGGYALCRRTGLVGLVGILALAHAANDVEEPEIGYDGYTGYDDWLTEDDVYDDAPEIGYDDDDWDDDDDFGYDDDEDDDLEFGRRSREERQSNRKRRRSARQKGRSMRRDARGGARELRREARQDGGGSSSEAWVQTVVSESQAVGAAGASTLRIRLNHPLEADDISFVGTTAATTITGVRFGDRLVWDSPNGVDVAYFAQTSFVRGLLEGQYLNGGYDIIITAILPSAGTLAAQIKGKKPANSGCR